MTLEPVTEYFVVAMSSAFSKRKGLNEDERGLIRHSYGRITHYFEKSKCLDVNVDAEYEQECNFALSFFEDAQIQLLASKLRKVTLWIECGSFLAVNLWSKMQNIIKLLKASKFMIHHLNVLLTHETHNLDNIDTDHDDDDDDKHQNEAAETRKYLFEQFMQVIVEASRYKLSHINFNIEGVERDINDIYILYLNKLLLPNLSNKNRTKSSKNKKKSNHITGLQLAIFGKPMLKDFCDEKTNKFLHAIIATSTLKTLSITFDNITITHKINSFLHSISLNNHIQTLSFIIHDRRRTKMKRKKFMTQFEDNNLENNDKMSVIKSFYITLYAIFMNKYKHLKSFSFEYSVSRNEICKLDDTLLMNKYVLQPIIDKCHCLSNFEWKVDMKWNEINLSSLSLLLNSNKHDFEYMNISKICPTNIEAMNEYISSLKTSNRCRELKLSGLNGRSFTQTFCDFIATDCGSTFEILRFKMRYEINDICLLEKHTMLILNCFILRLQNLYKIYKQEIPSILREYGIKYNDLNGSHGLPQYLISIIVDYCKMRFFKLDFSLLMNRKLRQPLTQNNLEQTISVEMNKLINKLHLNKNENGEALKDEDEIFIKRDIKNNHPLLLKLFDAFCYTKDVNFYFTAVDCKLLFSINP